MRNNSQERVTPAPFARRGVSPTLGEPNPPTSRVYSTVLRGSPSMEQPMSCPEEIPRMQSRPGLSPLGRASRGSRTAIGFSRANNVGSRGLNLCPRPPHLRRCRPHLASLSVVGRCTRANRGLFLQFCRNTTPKKKKKKSTPVLVTGSSDRRVACLCFAFDCFPLPLLVFSSSAGDLCDEKW